MESKKMNVQEMAECATAMSKKELIKVYECEKFMNEAMDWVLNRNTPTTEMVNFTVYAEKKVKTLPDMQRVSFNYHPKMKLNADSLEAKLFKAHVVKFARNFGFDEVEFDYDTNTVTITDTFTHAAEETKMVNEFLNAGVEVTMI